ncbi:MAG: J domain-containing protein [Betaproteobacteria bacterium]
MEKVHTHYDNLRVTRNAPVEVIRAAFRALAQKHHPDVNPSADSVRVMKLYNEAWAVLGDSIRRAEHDQWIREQERAAESARASATEHTFTAGSTRDTYSHDRPSPSSSKPSQTTQSGATTSHSAKAESSFSGTAAMRSAKVFITSLVQRFVGLFGKFASPFGRPKSFPLMVGASLLTVIILMTLVDYVTRVNGRLNSVSAPALTVAVPEKIVVVKLPNGVSVNFPEGMTPEAMSAAIVSKFPEFASPKSSDSKRAGTTFSFEEASKPRNIEPPAAVPDPWAVVSVTSNEKLSRPGNVEPHAFAPFAGTPDPVKPPVNRPMNGYIKGERQKFVNGLSSFTIDNNGGTQGAEVRLYRDGAQVRSLFVRVGSAFTAEGLAPGTYKMRYKTSIDGRPHVFQARDDFSLTQTETDAGTRFWPNNCNAVQGYRRQNENRRSAVG